MTLNHEVTICFATINRPPCVIRLVKSIREHLGAVRILVGEQSPVSLVPPSTYNGLEAEIIRLPNDFGVSASRNALVSRVETPYFLLCDDDFIMGPDTNLSGPLKIMAHEPHVAIVGGKLFDLWENDSLNHDSPRHWERFLSRDLGRRRLLLQPIEMSRPHQLLAGQHLYFDTDTVMNWALMRTAAFQESGVAWDDRFKIAGEHEDFYLNLWVNFPHLKVAYDPSLVAYHHHMRLPDYVAFRDRTEGWTLFHEKWDVDEVVEFGHSTLTKTGTWLRTPTNIDEFLRMAAQEIGRDADLPPSHIGIDQMGRFYCSLGNLKKAGGDILVVNNASGKLGTISVSVDSSQLNGNDKIGFGLQSTEPQYLSHPFLQSRGYRIWREYVALYKRPFVGSFLRTLRKLIGLFMKRSR